MANANDIFQRINKLNEQAEQNNNIASVGDKTNVYSELEKLIVDAFTRYYNRETDINANSVYLKGRSTKLPENKLMKLISSVAPGIIKEQVIFVKDVTFFDADQGMIITSDKVYYKTKKHYGSVDIKTIDGISTTRKLLGDNITNLRDLDDNTYEMGEIACLQEHLDALQKSFEDLIKGLRKMRKEGKI